MTSASHLSPHPSLDGTESSSTGRNFVLVGLMGAGKTHVGRRLADALGLPFVDADQAIEEAAGCAIPEIFARHGEAAFREGERKVIRRLLNEPGQRVLATGGGAFMDPATREEIRRTAVSIWLRASLDVLVKRTSRRSDRPLLTGGDPREILTTLMEKRHPVYAEADLVVESDDSPGDATVARVIEALRARGLVR